MRIPALATYSCALAVAITLAGCGSDGSQSPRGFSPVGSTQSATTSAIEFKWFSAKYEMPPEKETRLSVSCSAPFMHVVAGGYEAPIPYWDDVVHTSKPAFNPDGWFVQALNPIKTTEYLTVWVDCTNAPVSR